MRVLANVFRKIAPPRPGFYHVLWSQQTKDKLWSLLLRCWEHDPSSRPTVTQVKQVLIEIERESTNTAT
ncbi:unnamed protein product [Rhizoctonia solani]|uniref:Serine-threonine/tyrosine-protein kinase catalytic domain-containing protein n=1 Tax=Rhizoctonia solani TaxID=456999 RepID=A0A8H3E926_9AGAM|nr:unnamed protein product [Rhizoctonia solani]